ncbi:MAG: hypothetical protein R2838_04050 [Caldilineaceae bacterium]
MVDVENPTMRDVFTRILTDATWVTAVNPAFLRRLDGIVPRTGGTSVIGNAVDTAALPRWEPTANRRGQRGEQVRPVKTSRCSPRAMRWCRRTCGGVCSWSAIGPSIATTSGCGPTPSRRATASKTRSR